MPSTDRDTTAPSTISVATISTIAIDLNARAAILPRQSGPGGEPARR